MKSCILIFLLLLSVLHQEAQGLRLMRTSTREGQNPIYEMNHGKININDAAEEGTLCNSKHCSGKIRKLLLSSTVSKKDQKEGTTAAGRTEGNKEKSSSLHASSLTEQEQHIPESHQDILDIAGMDYSQAMRKPPIHN